MQYIFLILVILWGTTWLIKKMSKSKKHHEKKVIQNSFTPEQHEFFEGKKQPYVDYKGKLINMDEHTSDVWDVKN